MPWWRIGRGRPADGGEAEAPAEERAAIGPVIREAERRSLTRLLRRQANLEYDIAQAESAFLPENRWTERMEELTAAIQQAEEDLAALVPEAPEQLPAPLPETPVEIQDVSVQDPASVRLGVGGHTFLYREEPDWAERGHQVALPELTLAEGDVGALVATEITAPQRERLANHLQNSLSIVANEALERAVDHEPLPEVTLADLARPCERCGGWKDVKGRCPSCAALDQRRGEIRAALDRLITERNDVSQDLAVARDRLPVYRRQLAEVQQDIAKLQAKGVEPF